MNPSLLYKNINTSGRQMQLVSILLTVSSIIPAISAESDSVIQFVVHAHTPSDVNRVFPGADIQFTWNNVYIVKLWTNDPNAMITHINSILENNKEIINPILPPLILEAATQRWIEYNVLWILMFATIFIAGCACGGAFVSTCIGIKKQALAKPQPCRTKC